MGALDDISQMKQQGKSQQEMINSLQEKGYSPRAINDALSQSQIKSAVSEGAEYEASPMTNPKNTYTPRVQEANPPQQEIYAPTPGQESAPAQEFYPQEEYESYDGGADTMIEIAEQVFSEKVKRIQKQIEDLNEFRNLAQTKIDMAEERLKRIEMTIDKLQVAILDRIGSYGTSLEAIKKEMSMMQDSFGKVVNQAVKGASDNLSTTKTKRIVRKK